MQVCSSKGKFQLTDHRASSSGNKNKKNCNHKKCASLDCLTLFPDIFCWDMSYHKIFQSINLLLKLVYVISYHKIGNIILWHYILHRISQEISLISWKRAKFFACGKLSGFFLYGWNCSYINSLSTRIFP